jgi:hypothetical protein
LSQPEADTETVDPAGSISPTVNSEKATSSAPIGFTGGAEQADSGRMARFAETAKFQMFEDDCETVKAALSGSLAADTLNGLKPMFWVL